jgi:hypothetical protein
VSEVEDSLFAVKGEASGAMGFSWHGEIFSDELYGGGLRE